MRLLVACGRRSSASLTAAWTADLVIIRNAAENTGSPAVQLGDNGDNLNSWLNHP